jgi:hypothetical protein
MVSLAYREGFDALEASAWKGKSDLHVVKNVDDAWYWRRDTRYSDHSVVVELIVVLLSF